MATIGKRILERRLELGMSQEELALKVGYKDRSSIAKIESGERDIRQKKLLLLLRL
jgi:repressor LexA